MHDKYMSFDPWWGGFSNIRMTYELVGAISVITGRTIILPHRIYCLFLSEWQDKGSWFDMFDALDIHKYKEHFDCVDYYDIFDYEKHENEKHYFENIGETAKLFMFGDEDSNFGPQKSPGNDYVLTCGIEDNEEFELFRDNRTVIDLDCEDKYIHFPRNLFGHFYYHVYGKNSVIRNKIKDKVNKGIQYKPEFFVEANTITKQLGEFNAIHVRRNDFLQVRKDIAEKQTINLLDDIKNRIPSDKPLFIATDEKDKSVFLPLKEKYNVFYITDFEHNRSDLSELLVDQLICSKADIFLGSHMSTFSDYVNILRAQAGKKDFHREGTNFTRPPLHYNRFPWETEQYSWDKIWDYHWKFEQSYFNIAVFGSHNSSIALSYKGDILEVVELERFIGKKNAAFYFHFPVDNPTQQLLDIHKYFVKKYGSYIYDNCMHNSVKTNINYLPALNYEWVSHHLAHVNNAIYQSPAKKSLNISFDGGSDEGHFNVYVTENRTPNKIFSTNQDICIPYAAVGHYLSPIKQEDNWWWGNLTYAGKVMGLSAYGKVNENDYGKMQDYFRRQQFDNVNIAHENFQQIFQVTPENRFDVERSYDIAATTQKVFEDIFEEIISPFVKQYPDHQLQFSGGGALNVINNAKWNAFVSPNPDDRGLALGMIMHKIKPGHIVDSKYMGSEVYDSYFKSEDYSIDDMITDLTQEKIIGLVQGRSEHGARALCNRSILCMPKAGIKDKLNNEVKHREPFRPFAPVCRKEDAGKWFKFGDYTEFMSHNAVVINDMPAIKSVIHEDHTARLQTVTAESNPFMYLLLSRMNELGHPPVLINTSFNVMGKPILNTWNEALWMLENTGLDVLTDGKKRIYG
tara:strand:- start:45 stop:2606 length:2562 start_codon:yes stop_codon:yes gene_type:complete